MPAPVNRVAIQIARGTYSNLAANISEFEEGELLYAKDENTLYIIENGVMVSLLGGSGNQYGVCITVADGGNADNGVDGGITLSDDLDGGLAS